MIPSRLTVLAIYNRYREDGGENRAVDLQHALLERHGHRVVVLHDDSLRITGARARIAAGLTGLYSPAAKRMVRAACARVKPDVVHVHNLYPFWSPSVLVAARGAGVPVVMSVHNYGLTCPIRTHFTHDAVCRKCLDGGEHWCVLRNCRGDLLESAAYAARSWVARLGGWFLEHVTVFAPVSDCVAAYLRDLGVADHRISIVPNPVGLPAAAADAAHGAYALYVGRLSVEKGVRTLLAAMEMTDPSLRLHVVGTGPEEARSRSGASSRITFHGYLPPHAVAAMYGQARFTVVPSVSEETFSLVAAESMSHAVPVIASRMGGLRELVRDGVDGVLCEPGNADALAAQMSRLWNDPALGGRMGQAARQRIATHYNEDRSYEQLMRAYALALASRGHAETRHVNGTGARERSVVVATIQHPTGETGVHTHFTEFLRWARARNVSVRLVTPFQAPAAVLYPLFGIGRLARPISMPFWVWWYRWSHALILKRELTRQLLACGPSVVYAQDPLSAKAAIELREAGAPIDVVLIVHFNGSSAEELATKGQIARGGPLYRDIVSLEREVLSSVDRVIFPSRYAGRSAAAAPRAEPACARSWHIPNFVACPARNSIGDGPYGDAITIGTLEPRKNHEFILRVFAEAHRRGRKYALTVVGSGPLGRSLRGLASDLGIAGSVRFTGCRPGAAALVAHHRVYVHSASIENCPIAVLEAMAAGVPVLAPRVGGIPELLTDGVEGLFWDLNDVSSAADRLIDVLEDERRRTSMGASARARYERDYSPDACCPALLDALLAT